MDALPASAPSMTSSPITEVCFVLPPALILLDLAGAADAFRIAASMGLPVRLRLLAPIADGEAATTALGVGLAGIEPLPAQLDDHAMIVVCGATGSGEQVLSSPASKALVAWLQRHGGHGRRLACVCSGALLAAAAGLLDSRRCTTHHSLLDTLRELAPTAEVLDSRVFVEDGEVYTSAGITAGIDLALHLIAGLGSSRLAAAVAREMAVYMRRASGDPALSPWLEGRNHMNTAIHHVQDALARAPDQEWPLARLADIGHLSVRSLTRHFREASGMSINTYHARLRLALARQALATGDSVERAAERAGLGSARQLRRLWSTHASDSPASARRR
ncbi:helix-turn-helix domain-containing protein [Rhodanobacter sp. B2A1Ga4]|uniref:GlxA family transcriptional regulator n=1 Tax=Rhodanobacter sp. B2A1Ga4 TaxID=2778647 RepID=UPI001FD1AA09|nr:helix-turn-helix domain-containing protein [Rhodanobacter sp. B2A1Ga4]